MKAGWRHDSYRHALAAKGIRTGSQKMFAKKSAAEKQLAMYGVNAKEAALDVNPPYATEIVDTPYVKGPYSRNSQVDSFAAIPRPVDPLLSKSRESAIRKEETARAISERQYEQALNLARTSTDYRVAIEMIKNPTKFDELMVQTSNGPRVDIEKVESLRSALNARILQNAQAGVPLDPDLKSAVSSEVLKRAETIQKYREISERREFESPLKKQFREELTPAVTAAAITAAPEGISQAGAAFYGMKETDTLEDFDQTSAKLRRSAIIRDNAAVGWEEQASPGFWDEIEGTRFRSSWDKTLQNGGGVNPVLNPGKKTRADVVQDRVDSMFANKDNLTNVDFKAYERGKKHFEEGNREELINDILDMQKQEAKLKNVNKFVDQLMGDMNSKENYADAFESGGSSNYVLGGSKGAEKLNDQINKLHEVKGETAKKYAEAFTRRRLMQQDLVRMDSQIQPRTDIPTTSPYTVNDKKNWWGKIDNPVIEGAKNTPLNGVFSNNRQLNGDQR